MPGVNASIREYDADSAWVDVSLPGNQTWWEVEITTDGKYLISVHRPDDPEDVPLAPPDDWFASPRAAALYLKSTADADSPQALGRFVVTAHKDNRDRVYSFDSHELATEFASELFKQGVKATDMAFYQCEPVPPSAIPA